MTELRICDDGRVLRAFVELTHRGQWRVCADNVYLGPDGWGGGLYAYPTQNAAEQALAEWKVKHICWITPQQVGEYGKESFEAAKHCSLIHWKQIQAAGWRGYKIAYAQNVVAIYSRYCAFCCRYPDRKNCVLKAECKGRCCHEYYIASGAEETGHSWDEAIAAMIARIEAAENPELPKKADPPKPLIALPVHLTGIFIEDAHGHFVCAQVEANMGQALCDLINGKEQK